MNARQRVRIEMLKRAAAFGREHAAQFAPASPNSAPTHAQELFAELEEVNTQIAGNLSLQASGAPGAGSLDKGTLRDALVSDLRSIARAAAYLAVRRGEPALMERFRPPAGLSDVMLVSRARAVAEAVRELGLVPDLVKLAMEPDFVEVLEERIGEFEAADFGHDDARASQAGASANRSTLITQGLVLVRGLDVIMNNKFKGNAELLGKWKFSSHVERTGERPKAPAAEAAAPVTATVGDVA